MRRERDILVMRDKYYDPEAYEDPEKYFNRYSNLKQQKALVAAKKDQGARDQVKK